MGFGVLKNFHPMVGYDLHKLMPPGSPTPGPPAPHCSMSSLMGTNITAQMGPVEFTHWGLTILRGSDIGPFIPHAGAPNCLLPLILISSASKSHFGSSQTLVAGKPVAAALLMVVNLNLNCGDPVAAPLDGVFALTAHMVGMTLGDILSGFVHMAFDIGLSKLLSWGNGLLFDSIGQKIYERALFGPMCSAFEQMGTGKIATWLLAKDFEEMMAKGLAAKLIPMITADIIGSPLGYSFVIPDWAPGGGTPLNALGLVDSKADPGTSHRGAMEETHDAVQKYIDAPQVPTHDVAPAPDTSPVDAGPADDGGAPPGGAPSTGPDNDGGALSTGPDNDGGAPSTGPNNDGGAPSTGPDNDGGAPSGTGQSLGPTDGAGQSVAPRDATSNQSVAPSQDGGNQSVGPSESSVDGSDDPSAGSSGR